MLDSEKINDFVGIFADGMQFSAILVILMMFLLHQGTKAVYWKVYGVIVAFLFYLACIKFLFIFDDKNSDLWYRPYIMSNLMLVPMFEGLFFSMYRQGQTLSQVLSRILKGELFFLVTLAIYFFSRDFWTTKHIAYVYTAIYGVWGFTLTLIRTRLFNRQIGYAYSNTSGRNLKWIRAVLLAACVLLGVFMLSRLFINFWTRLIYDVVSLFVYTAIGFFLYKQKPVNANMLDDTRLFMEGDMIDNVHVKTHDQVGKSATSSSSRLNASKLLEIGDRLNDYMRTSTIYTDSNVTISDIAKAADINPVHLSYYINNEMGVRFVNYINDYRLDYAVELLMKDKDLSLDDIALKSGFEKLYDMQELFEDRFQCTMKMYREKDACIVNEALDEFLRKCESQHPGYHDRLMSYEPTLTKVDEAICMLVVMGYSFNKVVSILNTGAGSLDVRYCRLRSKLRLLRTDSLKQTLESVLLV